MNLKAVKAVGDRTSFYMDIPRGAYAVAITAAHEFVDAEPLIVERPKDRPIHLIQVYRANTSEAVEELAWYAGPYNSADEAIEALRSERPDLFEQLISAAEGRAWAHEARSYRQYGERPPRRDREAALERLRGDRLVAE